MGSLGLLDPGDGDVEEPPAPTGWPCLECGARNDFELSECAGCGIAFGAPLREAAPSLPGTRQTRLLAATGIVVLVMCAIALLSVVTSSDPGPPEPSGDVLVPVEVPAGQPVAPPSG
ncbi:MAG TPA: hypothetical protein VNB94_07700 [Mycobacteriales bacterium]|nr:hypothetical protein [Mycobacteriales bacterium]